MEQPILFEESTKPYKGIILLLMISYLLLIYGVVRQVLYGIPLGNKPLTDVHLIIFTICLGISIFLFSRMRTTLKITEEGFYLRTIPLISGDLNRWHRLKEIRIEKYSPIQEHLGFGFRDMNSQTSYLAGGQPGVKLEFRNGDKVLLAARDQEKLISILNKLKLIVPDYDQHAVN
ncbi:hypothetical protein [Sphingobacterium corticibacter]|uniref:Uncharacterized protein n=1 Tax=Sphingobacterium corticibacter TaxID=2171749 RepID=A0A2T8HMG7_9SPHI|nr:hypothetical protein [Sphingobacterium corticibacter]PVH26627.1 hypothetical protein DC487_03175 [Sphingobacterium corticibacter]